MSYNEHQVTELVLYTINSHDIYFGYTKSTIRNLAKTIAKGTYNHEKALKAFYTIAIAGAKSYHAIHGTWGDKWFKMFTVADRYQAAQELLKEYIEEIEEEAC